MGVFLPTKAALPEMVKRGGGSIISTGSESAFRGNGGFCGLRPYEDRGDELFHGGSRWNTPNRGIRSNTRQPRGGPDADAQRPL